MASIQTPKGRLHYKPVSIYWGFKQINREVAFDNLKIVVKVMNENNIKMSPACGTLLGIIRDNNFIEWDEDIDLFILSEDKDKLLEALWILQKEGFSLVRVDRCNMLYSVMRNGEYIDFYIMTKISPEIRTDSGDVFMFEKYLTELMDWDFNGLTISVPKDYDECLSFLYGDWRTPVKYYDFNRGKIDIKTNILRNKLKNWIPEKIRLKMMKKYHRKDLDKFLAKCEEKGIKLKYEVSY